MKTKTYIIIGIVALVVVIAFFSFRKKDAGTSTAKPLGTTKSGKPYIEADVQKEIAAIKATPDWLAQIDKTRNDLSLDAALRANALWMLENVD